MYYTCYMMNTAKAICFTCFMILRHKRDQAIHVKVRRIRVVICIIQ